MVKICFYFQVHQPLRMRKYSIFDIGQNHNYFDDQKNISILRKIARKCYLPANKLMLDLLKKHPEFKISFSFSGIVLEQFEKWAPDVLKSFQELVNTGQVEILAETYYHSLSFIYSKEEFREQVELHSKKIYSLFKQKPAVFRNTELIYNNEVAHTAEKMGFKGILAEGWEHVLKDRSPNFLYAPHTTENIKLILKNYKLSDDIAFRFSDKNWPEYPLTVGKFTQWLNRTNGNGECVNLFMDYETIGEHQWKDSGIFEFLKELPSELLKHPDNQFATPSELISSLHTKGSVDCHHYLSWADMERDLSAWLGNKMQQSSIKRLYCIEQEIKESNDPKLIEDWRRLQTSDHFYYMCTKWFSDGDVHKYFSPYTSPYDSFINLTNILNDILIRLKSINIQPKQHAEIGVRANEMGKTI